MREFLLPDVELICIMREMNVFMAFVFVALVAALSVIFYRMRKRDDLKHLTSPLPARFVREGRGNGYIEEKTRFVETTRKKRIAC